MTLTMRNAWGLALVTVSHSFPANSHEQLPAVAFVNGFQHVEATVITVLIDAGSAIVYGATVDNRTGDPSLQIARPAP